jgi:pimeloyl-ACP methyl ester carboxylesterase
LKHNTENQMPGIEGVRNQTEDGFHFFDWGGNGPVAHIAHATGLAAGVYAPLAERLTSNFRVHAMDIRGHGRSSAPAEPARLKNWEIFYQDMERFFERFERPLVAIGHSMGGTVSMVAAARRPDLVSALVLIEPGVMSPAWRPWVYLVQKLGLAMRVPFVTRATKRKKAWPDVEEVRKDLYGKGTFRRWQDDFFSAYLDSGLTELQDGGVGLACDPLWEGRCLAMAPTDIWKYVPQVSVPTLIIHGTKSTTFLPSVARRFGKQLPGVLMKPFQDAGHFVPMEDPDKCTETILRFISRL